MEILVTAREETVTVIELTAREVMRLPRARHTLRVLRGNAWVTDARGDRLLWPGDAAVLPPSVKIPAVIGGLGDSPLVLELTGEEAAWWSLKTYGTAKRRSGTERQTTSRSFQGQIQQTACGFWTLLRRRFGGRPEAETPPCASTFC